MLFLVKESKLWLLYLELFKHLNQLQEQASQLLSRVSPRRGGKKLIECKSKPSPSGWKENFRNITAPAFPCADTTRAESEAGATLCGFLIS